MMFFNIKKILQLCIKELFIIFKKTIIVFSPKFIIMDSIFYGTIQILQLVDAIKNDGFHYLHGS